MRESEPTSIHIKGGGGEGGSEVRLSKRPYSLLLFNLRSIETVDLT